MAKEGRRFVDMGIHPCYDFGYFSCNVEFFGEEDQAEPLLCGYIRSQV